MSDEEKKAIANLKTEYEKLIKEDNILFPLYKSDAKRLIDIIEKQSKEIEELRNEVMEKELIIDGMKEDRRIAVEEIQEQYYVSKDKIKKEIEEIRKTHAPEDDYAESQIYILQSLLEKE